MMKSSHRAMRVALQLSQMTRLLRVVKWGKFRLAATGWDVAASQVTGAWPRLSGLGNGHTRPVWVCRANEMSKRDSECHRRRWKPSFIPYSHVGFFVLEQVCRGKARRNGLLLFASSQAF